MSVSQADLILCNAKVMTLDAQSTVHQAIAVTAGRITAVGSDASVKALGGPRTEVIDLLGRTVLPGINDSHMHAAFFGGTRPPLAVGLYYPGVGCIADMVEALRKQVDVTPSGAWIRGFGWDAANLKECSEDRARLPRRWDIDSVSPDNPVVLNDFSGHTMLANTRALELAGITRDTPDPASGEIERDEHGAPTGIFKELEAMGLVFRVVPLLTREEKREAVVSTLRQLAANGITSFTDAALGPGGDTYSGGLMAADILDIYRELADEGRLTARVTALLLFGEYGGLSVEDLKRGMAEFQAPAGMDGSWFQIPGIKLFADGIPLTKTSYMHDDYLGGGHGALTVPGASEEEQAAHLVELIGLAHGAGYQVAVHATGDRATDIVVEGFAKAMADDPRPDPRHYVVHGEFLSPKTARRLAELKLGVAMQPAIQPLIADIEPMIVGPERAAYEWPLRTALDSGLNLTASSDMPVTGPNWRAGVQAAVLRGGLSGKVSGPAERIGLVEALRLYTVNGAWQDRMEDVKGTLEAGKFADLCVLDGDILALDPHEIGQLPVLMTIVGGITVYDAR